MLTNYIPAKLLKFKLQHKLTAKDHYLLVEALRRKNFSGSKKDITDPKLGLGTPYTYKSRFFTVSNGREVPRQNNWYKLTEEGMNLVSELESIIVIPKSKEDKYRVNGFLAHYKIKK